MTKPFIQSIQLKNFLSFGSQSEAIPLLPINIIIGANGSGKSNFLEAFELLRRTPGEQLVDAFRHGGGVAEWLWKGSGEKNVKASIEAVVSPKTNARGRNPLRYGFSFIASNHRFEIVGEKIEDHANNKPCAYYKFGNGCPVLNARKGGEMKLRRDDINPERSILAQRRDPDRYPELDYLARSFGDIKLFREWTFGQHTVLRRPQRPDLPSHFLLPDASNLAHVLNAFQRTPTAKQRLLDALKDFYGQAEGYEAILEGGSFQLYLNEGAYLTPSSRLSDGTLRYLALLAILCHPKPPPVVCIEEPELGLHPDVLPDLAELLKEASKHTQLIVTTHSDILVGAFSDQPEAVLVTEKSDTGTTLTRLCADELKLWLEHYSLGQLWNKGEIGGKRW